MARPPVGRAQRSSSWSAALLGLTALLTDRLTVDGFWTALVGGLILAVVSWAADQLLDR